MAERERANPVPATNSLAGSGNMLAPPCGWRRYAVADFVGALLAAPLLGGFETRPYTRNYRLCRNFMPAQRAGFAVIVRPHSGSAQPQVPPVLRAAHPAGGSNRLAQLPGAS